MRPNPDNLMTPQEVANILNIKIGTLYKKVQAKTIPFIQINKRCVRFDRKALDKWIAQSTFTPAPKPSSLIKRRSRGYAA